MFKYIWKKKFTIFILIVIGGGIWYMVSSGDGEEAKYDFAEVAYVDITQDVSVTGTVEADPKINLKFQAAGQVEDVYVDVGDYVSVGASLARLDTVALAIQVDSAEADLALAQANYDQAVAGSTQEAILVAEAAVEKAQADLANSEQDLENTEVLSAESVSSAELDYQTALTNYENAIDTYGEDVEHAYEDAYNVLDEALNELDDTFREIDNILGVENEAANDDYELSFEGAHENTYKELRNIYEDWDDLYDVLFAEHSDAVNGDDHDVIDGMLVDCDDLLGLVESLLDDVDDFLVDVSIIGGYTLAAKETLRSAIATEISDMATVSTSVDNAVQAIESAVTDQEANLESYEDALSEADQALEAAIAQEEADILSAEVAVSVYEALLLQAEANLAEVEAGPRDVDLASLEASIESAETALSLAEYNLSEAYITAPVSGVITEVYFDEGENVTAAEDFLVMVSDDYQIVANVSETDIAKVDIGDRVVMTLDAFSYDKEFEAEIIEIDPAETVVQGVIYYQITAVFTAEDADIKPGMTANMDIVTAEVTGVLAVPLRAVKYDGARTYVWMVDILGETYEVDVETGVEGSQYVEVVSGLEEGDEVVTYVR